MFGFKKAPNKNSSTDSSGSWFSRLKNGLGKTRGSFEASLGPIVSGQNIDDDTLEEIETLLLSADMGIETTTAIVQDLTQKLSRKELADGEGLFNTLREDLKNILTSSEQTLTIDQSKQPFVILMIGVNGVGKTTTIGKLARQFQSQGHSVMLAAGDTFRAAAVEQLQVWGERNDIPVIAQQSGADSASVIFDAIEAARARNIDILIADTAGRLHTQSNLMEELKKVKRVIGKLDASAPHEVMLVVDAGTGQNALTQARQFHQDIGITGITMTKLDGTAKGGIIFAIAKQLDIPIRFIGVGEGIDDLQAFHAEEFVQALFDE